MSARLKIVVADDDARMREFYLSVLGKLGHEVRAAADGDELVALCRHRAPDLIVTDVRMPGRDGLAAAGAVNEVFPVPVIVVSAYHDEALRRRLAQPFVRHYLLKPIKATDLAAAVTAAARGGSDAADRP